MYVNKYYNPIFKVSYLVKEYHCIFLFNFIVITKMKFWGASH